MNEITTRGIYVDPQTRSELEDFVLAYINDAYRFRQKGQPEPSISVTDVLDYLLQSGRCPMNLRYNVWLGAFAAAHVSAGWTS